MRLLRYPLVIAALTAACAGDNASEFKSCTPGAQIACDCPGGLHGAQVCDGEGKSYGPCTHCASGTGGSGGFPSGGTGGSGGSGGVAASGGAGSGGTGAGASGGSTAYVDADCLVTANNEAEVCDDAAADVPAPPQGLVLVCLNANGGTTYVASNTGPVMFDGVPRCQGWETTGQNAWDHLQYIAKLECDIEQQTLDIDLTSYVGSPIWFGTHDDPAGGGHNTPVCVAYKK